MTDLLPAARAIIRACLVREFCDPKRKWNADPVALRRELERYCNGFGFSVPKR
jgi:hypothetical protein